ncbi:MAG: phosphoribosylformylglycinamidine synthase subunit PurL [Rhodospirillaceae bacterium]|jgi:phosphoribosylformylglycinamidine synthase subunit PurL|nr:phosphoribosylformylglycinamidine synthase subunit PurL [Rhodospirillaceae bacterium]MBT5941680.1 phosphoribosylformylglycinamidine synthase subunit PurL [Rhodospirillaceae bacterium]MBT7267380.1 phosphoribosylformylglycinamidine synthase subunit PurL [Rhodospirillaceae bacterium]
MSEITPEVVAEHGLSEEEYKNVLEIMGREPNLTELGVFSVMWSEHCSYKSSKKWLKTLPTEAPWVICGPGENAGIVDIGDGQAAVFKMESHNHPSYIEPYQGAATGVGGILRDVFTMGARPIANMNALRFGSPDHPKTQHLVSGVVSGIGGYGNCIGVPTVGGETNFHSSYDGNILVNAMTVGLADADNIFYSAATGAGNPVVYVGSKTGRDGIHGATMASTEFNADSEEKRPTVQVGDPFTEKLLVEACLELMSTDVIVAIQDMGAAGLTSSAFEMASKGGVGVEMDLDQVPAREEGMTAYEFLLSESQERMLMVLEPGKEHVAQAIMEKWELDFAVVGHLTDTGRMVIKMNGEIEADLPIDPLALASPEYDRPWVKTEPQAEISASDVAAPDSLLGALKQIVGSPDMSSRRWIWEQYDHMVMGDTVQRPGGDAAVVRVQDTEKGLAITTDCTPRYCLADPVEGGKQAVAETWRNLTAVGARPLAITDNMNFGNPEKPEIMGQFVGAIEGIRDACNALDYPVVSGNVSLYNETAGQAILPTPAIGAIGIMPNYRKSIGVAFQGEGESILLIGDTKGHLGQSIYLREIDGREEGMPPHVDLTIERRNGDCVRSLIEAGDVTACHDLSDGGLLVAVAEMAMASTGASAIGAEIADLSGDVPLHAWAYGEDQARYLVTTTDAAKIIAACEAADVPVAELGTTGGATLSIAGETIAVAELKEAHESWLPNYMAAAE